MLELEVYAAGLGDLEKILELDHQLAAVPGLRYKVDRSHNLVLSRARSTHHHLFANSRSIRHFIGAIPNRASPKNKTQAAGCLNTTANVRSIL